MLSQSTTTKTIAAMSLKWSCLNCLAQIRFSVYWRKELNYVNEPLFFTELVQFGENLDCFVLLDFKNETIQYFGESPSGDISVEIIPLTIDGINVFNPSRNSLWKVRVNSNSKSVEFGPGHIVHDDGPFKYQHTSIKGRGLGTYILSKLIEISKVSLGEYGSDITMGTPFSDNSRLVIWYKSFGFREGIPYHHKGKINDLKTRGTDKPLNVLYSSVKCRDTCGFSKNLDDAERLIAKQKNEIEEYKQISRLKGKGNDQLFLGCIAAFVLSLVFSKIAFLGFLIIIIHQVYVASLVSNLRKKY